MTVLDALYQRLPPLVQTAMVSAYGLRVQRERYGTAFRRLEREWGESQWWPPERLRAWQDERLRRLVRHAYDRVPFYRRLYDRNGIDPKGIEGVADLPRLPLLQKEDVRSAEGALFANGRGKGLVHGHTSGTTGSPLGVWYDRGMCVANNAADWRQKRWGGMRPGDWCGMFLGRMIVPSERNRRPFWRINYVQRQVWFSSFHMNEENIGGYIQEIRRRGLRFLEGYPSTLFILARHVLRRGEQVPLQAVFTSSETLHAIQREAIAEAFGCPIFDFYGLAERMVFAGECEAHDGKHLFDEYGITEIVDDEGKPVPDGQQGWLAGTSLWNFGMPFIRYRTGDRTARLADRCPCGRSLGRIEGVTTKAEDIVVTPEGRFISPSVLTHPFKPYDQIVKSQIIQEATDRILVKLVPAADFSREHQSGLVHALQERLGGGMAVEVEIVDEIPAERSGKFRWVISRVPHTCSVEW